MPELPEVETIRRVLSEILPNQCLKEIYLFRIKLLRGQDPKLFRRRLKGASIQRIERRAKFLLVRLDRDDKKPFTTLMIHLGMTGQVIVQDSGSNEHEVNDVSDKHLHLRLETEDGLWIDYRDPRMFGRFGIIDAGEELRLFSRLGPEPLGNEFTPEFLCSRIKNRKTSVKAALLDQKTVAGMGNIYADEALFRAGIRPHTRSSRLTKARIRLLHDMIRDVLQEAIHRGGTSLSDYLDPRHQRGTFQLVLQVYGREGKRCRRCGSMIKKAFVAQRGTHWCPRCQR